MNDFLKNGFLLGIGAAIMGKEKLEDNITKLVQKGMMSQTEADSIFNEFLKKGQEKSDSWNQDFRNNIRNQLMDLGFVTREELDLVRNELNALREENLKNNDNKKPLTDYQDSLNGEKPVVDLEKDDNEF